MRSGVWLASLAFVVLLSGCVSHQRAQNPLPGVVRVAVAPFSDKTNGDIGVDSLEFTRIFASELQKIPSYEVVPVQEVLDVIGTTAVETNQPALAFALARAVHAQAVIVGDITDYSCYYPLRVGLHCEMYAMVTGEPQAVVQNPPRENPERDGRVQELGRMGAAYHKLLGHFHGKHFRKSGAAVDGQSCGTPPDGKNATPPKEGSSNEAAPSKKSDAPPSTSVVPEKPPIDQVAFKQYTPAELPRQGVKADAEAPSDPLLQQASAAAVSATSPGASPPKSGDCAKDGSTMPGSAGGGTSGSAGLARGATGSQGRGPRGMRRGGRGPAPDGGEEDERLPRPDTAVYPVRTMDYGISVLNQIAPRPVVEPWVIRHSRVFDSTNLGLSRKLRQYYFFKRDFRGGEWVAYAERTDDFNRFVCDRMIFEMLDAAGGKWQTLRGFSFPQPWHPWPWR